MFYGDYTDSPTGPLFAFGHGLSYTSFAVSDLTVDASSTNEPVTVACTIANTGGRAGTDVVQLYVTDEVASTARPDRQLVGFTRLELAAGASSPVRFAVHPSRLAFFDPRMRFVCEPGDFTFAIGHSAADIVAAEKVRLGGEVRELLQRQVVATAVQTS